MRLVLLLLVCGGCSNLLPHTGSAIMATREAYLASCEPPELPPEACRSFASIERCAHARAQLERAIETYNEENDEALE